MGRWALRDAHRCSGCGAEETNGWVDGDGRLTRTAGAELERRIRFITRPKKFRRKAGSTGLPWLQGGSGDLMPPVKFDPVSSSELSLPESAKESGCGSTMHGGEVGSKPRALRASLEGSSPDHFTTDRFSGMIGRRGISGRLRVFRRHAEPVERGFFGKAGNVSARPVVLP